MKKRTIRPCVAAARLPRHKSTPVYVERHPIDELTQLAAYLTHSEGVSELTIENASFRAVLKIRNKPDRTL